MDELGAISDLGGPRRAPTRCCRFSLDTADPERGALLQRGRELGAEIETLLLFFELEWNELPDARADELLADDGLAFCRHYLRTLRRYRPHQLSEPEERVLTETSVTGLVRLPPAVHGADLGAAGRPARTRPSRRRSRRP